MDADLRAIKAAAKKEFRNVDGVEGFGIGDQRWLEMPYGSVGLVSLGSRRRSYGPEIGPPSSRRGASRPPCRSCRHRSPSLSCVTRVEGSD